MCIDVMYVCIDVYPKRHTCVSQKAWMCISRGIDVYPKTKRKRYAYHVYISVYISVRLSAFVCVCVSISSGLIKAYDGHMHAYLCMHAHVI